MNDLDRRAALALGWKPRVNKHGYWDVYDPDGIRQGWQRVLAVEFDRVTGKKQENPWTLAVALPVYSTDMNAAMELVTFANKHRWYLYTNQDETGHWAHFFTPEGADSEWKKADILATAITLAFLELKLGGKI